MKNKPGKKKKPQKLIEKLLGLPLPRILSHLSTGILEIVGATGFEPATSASRTQRSTKLSHAPIYNCPIILSYTQEFV